MNLPRPCVHCGTSFTPVNGATAGRYCSRPCWYQGKSALVLDNFWEDFQPQANGCLLWMGAVTAGGYGTVKIGRTQFAVHRLAWMLSRGPIPKGLLVCHHCDVRHCGEPSHLFVGTNRDNTRDMMDKGRFKAIANQYGPFVRYRVIE